MSATTVHVLLLYSRKGAYSLIGACAKKRNNMVFIITSECMIRFTVHQHKADTLAAGLEHE